jgi:hypothetical protein
MTVSRWLSERAGSLGFRLRLLRMALRPLDQVSPLVVMALESPDYDVSWLEYRPGEPGAPAGRWV